MSTQIEDDCESCKCYTCGEEYPHSPERCGCGNDWVKGWYDKLTFSVQVFRDTEDERPVYTGILIADCHDSARDHEHELKKKYPHPQYEVVLDDVSGEEQE